jgi:hypothetical protein
MGRVNATWKTLGCIDHQSGPAVAASGGQLRECHRLPASGSSGRRNAVTGSIQFAPVRFDGEPLFFKQRQDLR